MITQDSYPKLMVVPKLSFSEAAAMLSSLIAKIDNEEDIDPLIDSQFKDSVTDVSKSLDRRKFFYNEILSKIELCKQYKEAILNEIKKYELIKERLIASTKRTIEENPEVPFKDSLGRPLKILNNPTPKVIYNEATPTEAGQYVLSKVVYEYDKETIKKALIAGEELEFARLEYGTQLRGLKY